MAEETDEWITAPDTARRLGLTLSMIYKLIKAGDLPAEITVPTNGSR